LVKEIPAKLRHLRTSAITLMTQLRQLQSVSPTPHCSFQLILDQVHFSSSYCIVFIWNQFDWFYTCFLRNQRLQ